MSDLRTRLAEIIDREVDGFWEPLTVADAVIRELELAELELTDEWGIRERGEPEPGILSANKSDLTKWMRDGGVLMRRLITDWTADE